MGYLTTFTVYNDGLSQLREHSDEFSEIIHHAGQQYESKEYALGYHCNLIKSQIPRHASENTIYVHLGNTVTEISSLNPDTEILAKSNPKFFNQLVNCLESELKYLKDLRDKINNS